MYFAYAIFRIQSFPLTLLRCRYTVIHCPRSSNHINFADRSHKTNCSVTTTISSLHLTIIILTNSRGRVEDKRPEAKAKDPKKFRGQGQTLSRTRTKDTGASVLQNKKGLQNFFFQAISEKRSSKTFFRRETSSKFFFQAIST